MNDLALAVLLGLAVYRAWRVFGADSITARPRLALAMAPGRVWQFVSELTGCCWCLGFWLSGIGAAVLSWGDWPRLALLWLAASTVAGVTNLVVDKLSRTD